MQPLNLGARPGRDERVFQVTNSALRDAVSQREMERIAFRNGEILYALFIVWELGGDRLLVGELAEEGVEGIETILGAADLWCVLDDGLLSSRVCRCERRHWKLLRARDSGNTGAGSSTAKYTRDGGRRRESDVIGKAPISNYG